MSGSQAAQNPFRFSTKFTDDESGLVYYGYRYYNPGTGRWISRDPIGERRTANLFGFCANIPTARYDVLGLADFPPGGPFIISDITRTPFRPLKKLPLPHESYCCTQDKIEEGRQVLIARFAEASAEFTKQFSPADPGRFGATCKSSSEDLIDWLMPAPTCWVCYREHRRQFPKWFEGKIPFMDYDHQVVICRALGQMTEAREEIIFDWWGDTAHPNRPRQSGGSPDRFRLQYPLLDTVTEYPFWVDGCGNQHGKPPVPGFSCCDKAALGTPEEPARQPSWPIGPAIPPPIP